MSRTGVLQPLSNWSVICLRPAAQQAAVRRAVQARGARHVALPGLRLAGLPAVAQLRDALACPVVVFTSPAAVMFAANRASPLPLAPTAHQSAPHSVTPAKASGHLDPAGKTSLHGDDGKGTRSPLDRTQVVFAVGAGTARALVRHGIHALSPPPDAMHSEGLLALPHWDQITGPVGLVTAPGGRGIIAAGLARRGLDIRRAEVYQRLPPRLDARHHRALLQSPAPRAVLVSSAEALDGALNALPAPCRTQLLDATAVACSARLAELAKARGFAHILTAPAPTAAAMLDALQQATRQAGSTAFR